MRIRTLKPEWLDDEKLCACSDAARVLSAGLILLADDYGRGRAGIGFLAGHVWSSELEEKARETIAKTSRALDELVAMRYVALYDGDGQHYFAIRNWKRHQKVDHPGKPHVPEPVAADLVVSRECRESVAPDRDLDLDPDRDPEGEHEGKQSVRSEAPAAPPKKKSPRKKPLVPMPPDWIPDKTRRGQAGKLGLDVAMEADNFRDWTGAKGMLYADWDRGFGVHLRSQAKRAGSHEAAPPPQKAWTSPSRLPPEVT